MPQNLFLYSSLSQFFFMKLLNSLALNYEGLYVFSSHFLSGDHLESTVFFPFRSYDRKILNVGFDLKYIDKNLLTDI